MNFIADTHTHTVASTHAFSTITENAAAAEKAGIKILAMTDHGTDMPDSPHEWHFFTMGNVPRVLSNVYILRGMEANLIDFEGHLDIRNPELYYYLEWIIASYHYPTCPPGTKNQHTNSYIRALHNPRVDVIGHSESMQYDYDFKEVARACREENKLIELNASRLWGEEAQKRYTLILEACAEEGAKIIVNSDAHFWTKIGQFQFAGEFLERLKFPKELVINTDEKRMKDYIISRKGNIFEN